MAEIVTLLQRVAQVVRRAPEPTLIQAYRDAARAFCGQSRWLRRSAEAIVTSKGEQQYDLLLSSADAGLEIINVRAMIGVATQPSSSWQMYPSDPTTWNPNNQGEGAPRWWAYVPEGEVSVWPVPDQAYTLTSTVQCQPTLDTEELPDDLLRKWDQALADGAMAYLLDIAGQPWSNPREAAKRALRFQAAINNAKADEQRSYNTGTSLARIPRLF